MEQPTLFVASTGGHLEQLHILAPKIAPDGAEHWVSFKNSQSESLLAGKDVTWLEYISPRDWRGTMAAVRPMFRLVRDLEPRLTVSTGAAIAVPALYAASLYGRRAMYIESLARSEGPSLTGRIVSKNPRIELRTQYSNWAGRRWLHEFSAMDGWISTYAPREFSRPMRVFVTLGTIKPYTFPRAVRKIQSILPQDAVVTWQTGVTGDAGVGIEFAAELSKDEVARAIETSDVVITHAGVGSALASLKSGKCPVLLPRRASFGEHVDDHQQYIAHELASRGLAVAVEVDELSLSDLMRAAGTSIMLDLRP